MKLGYFRIWGGGGVKEIRISEKKGCENHDLTKTLKIPGPYARSGIEFNTYGYLAVMTIFLKDFQSCT